MRRPECDPDDVRMADVLCDFCRREWSDALPMVEGHQGSCICGDCLGDAFRESVLAERPDAAPARCTLCLEERADAAWERGGARACRRCVRQSAAVLQKDPDLGWRRPTAWGAASAPRPPGSLRAMETYLGEADERVIVIVADGGLNSGTAAQIEEVVQRAVDCGMRGVIVDCSKLDILSSAGLGRLLMLHKRMKQHGGEVRIAGLKGMAVQVIRLAKLDGIFELYPDVSQARLAFRPKPGGA